MKNLSIVAALLNAILLLSNFSVAQTADSPVAVARCAYSPREEACNSQFSQPAFRPRASPIPPRPYHSPFHAGLWRSDHSGRCALIGAIIGASIGAAICARSNVGVRPALALSGIGAGMGAAFALGPPPMAARNPYWRPRWKNQASQDEDVQNKPHQSKKMSSRVDPKPLPQPSPAAE